MKGWRETLVMEHWAFRRSVRIQKTSYSSFTRSIKFKLAEANKRAWSN